MKLLFSILVLLTTVSAFGQINPNVPADKDSTQLIIEFLKGFWVTESDSAKIEFRSAKNELKFYSGNTYEYEFFRVLAFPLSGTTISWPPHGCVIRKVDDTHIEVEYENFGQKPVVYRYKKLRPGK